MVRSSEFYRDGNGKLSKGFELESGTRYLCQQTPSARL